MLRQVESITGIAAGVIGLIGILSFALTPMLSEESTDVSSTGTRFVTSQQTERLIDDQPGPVMRVLFVGTVVLFGVAFGAWRHARSGSAGSGLLLIVSTILLWLGAILGMFSVGLFVLPAALLALVALLACGLGRDVIEASPATR